jgi:ABC-type transport system involved in Fe-S cluster assembly fused permease/ATPase subunit
MAAAASTTTTAPIARHRYWRIAKELGQHVWPTIPAAANKIHTKNDMEDTTTTATTVASSSNKDNSSEQRQSALMVRYRVVASICLMLAGKAVTISTPFLFKMLVDVVGTTSSAAYTTTATPIKVASSALLHTVVDSTPIPLPMLLLFLYGLCRSLSSLLREYTNVVFSHVAQAAIRTFGRSTFDHVHSLDLKYHLDRNTGTVSRILERGSRSISFVLNAMVFNTLPTVIEVVVVSTLMLRKFGYLYATTVLSTIVAYCTFTIHITRWRAQMRKDMITSENSAAGRISDSLLNYETVKYFNNEIHEGNVYDTALKEYQTMAIKTASSLSTLNVGQNVIFSLGLTIIMYLTLHDVRHGHATVGDLVLVNGLLFQLSVPLNFIGWVYQEIRQSFIDMEAMFQLRDTCPQIVDVDSAIVYDPGSKLGQGHGTMIEFDNVEFGYESSSSSTTVPTGNNGDVTQSSSVTTTTRPILKKTSLTIPQGKTVAIVGSSGCGKSTLLRLMYRFYDPHSGSIRIGGRDMRDYTVDSIRRAIAVVPQDVVLFNDSIGYNIHYGNLHATWEEVIDASKKAHLHDTIMRLPNGYDTIVGERGLKMSGGEKQRVSIARAILKKAPILLCDEPTSSLDSQTESEIMNNLKEIGNDADVTCVIIAHRLSTIQDCDEIVVMDGGRVIEQGSHDELMVLNGGRYRELVAVQRNYGTSSDDDEEKEDGVVVVSTSGEVLQGIDTVKNGHSISH